MKKLIFLLFVSLVFVSCQKEEPIVIDEPTPEGAMIEFITPVKWEALDVMKGNEDFYEELMAERNITDMSVDEYLPFLAQSMHIWETGKFVAGAYEGQRLVTTKFDCEGPCSEEPISRFAVDEDGKWTLLEAYSNYFEDMEYLPLASVDSTIKLEEFEYPESMDLYENAEVNLQNGEAMFLLSLENYKPEKLDFEVEGFEYLFRNGGCIFGVKPDGVVAKYGFAPLELAENDLKVAEYGFHVKKETTLSLEDGEKITKEFSAESGGCGIGMVRCLSLIKANDGEKSALVKIGMFGSSEAYMFESVEENPSEEDMLMSSAREAYNTYKMAAQYSDKEVMSEEEFFNGQNAFFVPTGDEYVLVRDAEFEPAAECGKPVIYLYPSKDTVVNVKVGIDEFTVTDPQYGENGWTVLAKPNGQLKNLADGLIYPYLFWEGQSAKKFSLSEGWTLKKSEVSSVLPRVLKDMGLNDVETADFMEFWAPHLAAISAPYIEFSFVPQKTFDQIAPLTITPAPDSVLRVFMYYRGAYSAGLPAPDYATPSRGEFSVIEWGGSLR